MNKIDQKAAVEQLTELMCGEDARGATFLIGAGLSFAAGIPLGRKIVQNAIDRFPAFCTGIDPKSRGAYGKVMGCLPPAQRRALLQPHFKTAGINWGHIALAHLMKTAKVLRVLSVNFDQVLARACGLLGLYPAIYDFGAAPVANVNGLAEPAIIHLHGQSYGFVQLNTEDETLGHIKSLGSVVRDSIQGRTLVIVGYSGESDGVLEALKECHDGSTALYWVDLAEAPSDVISPVFRDHRYAKYVGGADADRFMLALVQSIARLANVRSWTPQVFHDPFGHLLKEMELVTAFPAGQPGQSDDVLSAWRKDVGRLRDDQKDAFRLTRDAEAAAIQGDSAAVTAAADKATEAGASDEALNRHRYWALVAEAYKIFEKAHTLEPSEARNALLRAADVYEQASRLIPNPHEALTNRGGTLVDLARLTRDADEQSRLLDLAIDNCRRALEYAPKQYDALYNWGTALGGMAMLAQASQERVKLFQEAIEKYKQSLGINPDQAFALNNWGAALRDIAGLNCERPERVRLLREAKGRFEDALDVRPDLVSAMNNLGATLLVLSVLAETPGEREDLLEEAAEKLANVERIMPGKASYNLACLMALNGRPDEAHEHLRMAHRLGVLPARKHLEEDTDLDSLRGLPWFEEILKAAGAAANGEALSGRDRPSGKPRPTRRGSPAGRTNGTT